MARYSWLISIAAIAVCITAAGCSSDRNHASPESASSAQATGSAGMQPAPVALTPPATTATTPTQQTYATPEQAVDAMAQAVAQRDRQQLQAVFGPRVRELGTGDRRQDDADLQRLWAALQRGYQLQQVDEDTLTLLVGPDEWRFPVPLVMQAGQWQFDTDEGIEEVVDRRVGRNELDAIATSRYYVAAQKAYFQMNPQKTAVPSYAQRIASSPGKFDGLYWAAAEDEPQSPLGPLVQAAQQRGELAEAREGQRQPYRGYFYKVLTQQGPSAPGGQKNYIDSQGLMTGGFGLLAWPAEYGQSGVMTFMVSQDGVIYQRDLGPQSQQAAESITTFDPTADWKPVEALVEE